MPELHYLWTEFFRYICLFCGLLCSMSFLFGLLLLYRFRRNRLFSAELGRDLEAQMDLVWLEAGRFGAPWYGWTHPDSGLRFAIQPEVYYGAWQSERRFGAKRGALNHYVARFARVLCETPAQAPLGVDLEYLHVQQGMETPKQVFRGHGLDRVPKRVLVAMLRLGDGPLGVGEPLGMPVVGWFQSGIGAVFLRDHTALEDAGPKGWLRSPVVFGATLNIEDGVGRLREGMDHVAEVAPQVRSDEA